MSSTKYIIKLCNVINEIDHFLTDYNIHAYYICTTHEMNIQCIFRPLWPQQRDIYICCYLTRLVKGHVFFCQHNVCRLVTFHI